MKASVFPVSFEDYLLRKEVEINLAMPQFDLSDSTNLNTMINQHNYLISELHELLRHESAVQIFTKALENTPTDQLLNFEQYYLYNNEARDEVYELGSSYALLFNKIIRVMVAGSSCKNLFIKMASCCFTEIRKR